MHVHATGAGYFAHAGAWVKLANNSQLANSSNWDTAYGWGDHSTQGYLTSAAPTSAQVGSATASLAFGAVGTYAFLVKSGTSISSGGTLAGSNLISGGVNAIQTLTSSNTVYDADMTGLARGDTTMTSYGTWRAMGSVTYNSSCLLYTSPSPRD